MATKAETQSTTPRDHRPGWLSLGRELRGAVAIVLAAMLLAPSGAIFFRRCCGAFDHALAFPSLVGAGLFMLLASEALWWLVERGPSAVVAPRFAALAAMTSGWMLAIGLSLRGSSLMGLFLLWALVLLETGLGAWRLQQRGLIQSLPVQPLPQQPLIEPGAGDPPSGATAGSSSSVDAEWRSDTLLDEPAVAHRAAESETESTLADAEDAPDDTPLAPGVVQQIVRREEPNGVHWLSGLVRVRFDAGQRVTHAHVAFCPPFLTTPTCEAETVAGPDAEVKVSQLLPHGVRFEARLDEASAEPSDVVIEFATQWQSTQK